MEKFIRQLPLVIAIILMISNCESANDQFGGGGGVGGFGDPNGGFGAAGGGYNDASSAIGGQQGKVGPDPSDSVSVKMPQQQGDRWTNATVRLKTMTKLDIYQRLSSYYQDMLKQANNQAQSTMMRNSQQMSQQFQQMQMRTRGMPPMNQQSPAQLQQYAQALSQQVQYLQMTNKQLQMQIQSGGEDKDDLDDEERESRETKRDEDRDDGYGENKDDSKRCREDQAMLKDIAEILDVNEDDDLAKVLEEKLDEKGLPSGAKDWQSKYDKLAEQIPTHEGESPEEALERILSNQRDGNDDDRDEDRGRGRDDDEEGEEGEEGYEGDDEDDEESGVGAGPSAKKGAAKKARKKKSAGAEDEDDDDEDDEDGISGGSLGDIEEEEDDGEMEEEEALEPHVFDPSKAPKSLKPGQKKQLQQWRKKHKELVQLSKCPHKTIPGHLTPAQEWSFLKHAFERLHEHAGCS